MLCLSHPLTTRTPLYGNSGEIKIVHSKQIALGDATNNTEFHFPGHCGTHIDAPFHFDGQGKKLEDYPISFWECHQPFLVRYAAQANEILRLETCLSWLETIPSETDILLVKTGFETLRSSALESERLTYILNNPGWAPAVGLWLRENRKLKMIGFDFISLTSYQNRPLGRVAHRAFLSLKPDGFTEPIQGDPILIIEDMQLSLLSQSPQRVIVAPFFYEQADGGPVTVFAEL